MRRDKKADDTESDVQSDGAVAGSRAPDGEYVGRLAGDTSGETGESGAEKRQRAAAETAQTAETAETAETADGDDHAN